LATLETFLNSEKSGQCFDVLCSDYDFVVLAEHLCKHLTGVPATAQPLKKSKKPKVVRSKNDWGKSFVLIRTC
jgi:hypothetical protein